MTSAVLRVLPHYSMRPGPEEMTLVPPRNKSPHLCPKWPPRPSSQTSFSSPSAGTDVSAPPPSLPLLKACTAFHLPSCSSYRCFPPGQGKTREGTHSCPGQMTSPTAPATHTHSLTCPQLCPADSLPSASHQEALLGALGASCNSGCSASPFITGNSGLGFVLFSVKFCLEAER